MQSSWNAYDWSRLSSAELCAFASVDDAVGVLRDAIAAVANVETLVRSPKVGPKALQRVVPGLQETRQPVTEALAALSAHLSDNEILRPALRDFLAHLTEARKRFGVAVDRASLGLFTARERLGFQSEVERFRSEASTLDELLRLLVGATQTQATEVDIREAIEHAFFSSQRGALLGNRHPRISAVLSLPGDGCTLRTHPTVLTPLVTLAVALVHRATGTNPSLLAGPIDDNWVSIVVSDATVAGDVFSVHAHVIVPPVLTCAKAAARACGGAFEIGPDERYVEMRWPRS